MKTLLLCLLTTVSSASLSFGQEAKPSLNQDPAFRRALTAIRYPAVSQRPAGVAKVYANFVVDKDGKIADIKLSKVGLIDESLLNEVSRVMTQLPAQEVSYAGEYVLPVVFEPQATGKGYRLSASDRAAFDKSYVQLTRIRTLLSEVYVAAN